MKNILGVIRIFTFSILLTFTVRQGFSEQDPKSVLLIHDFDSGIRASEHTVDFGHWLKDPKDPTQGCIESFSSDEKYGPEGMSLRLDYDVDSPNVAYDGFFLRFLDVDLTGYKFLNFYVKGDAAAGFPKTVKLELKADTVVKEYFYTGITDQWKLVKIPLVVFSMYANAKNMTEFTIGFEDAKSSSKAGTIYVDKIFFSKD